MQKSMKCYNWTVVLLQPIHWEKMQNDLVVYITFGLVYHTPNVKETPNQSTIKIHGNQYLNETINRFKQLITLIGFPPPPPPPPPTPKTTPILSTPP